MFTEEEKKQLRAAGLNPDEWRYVPEETAKPAPVAQPSDSALPAFSRSAARGLIPSLGAAIGGTLPAYLLGPEVGIPATIAATLLGGGLGSIGATKAQDIAINRFAPSWNEQAAIDAQQHPLASTLGGVASALPAFELSPGASIRGLGAAYRLGRGGLNEAETLAARQMAGQTGAQLGLGAATGVVNPLLEGRAPTLEDVGMGVGQAALLGRHRGYLGEIPGLGFMRHPSATAAPLTPSMAPPPPEGPVNPPFQSRYGEGMSVGNAMSAGGQNELIRTALGSGYNPSPTHRIGMGTEVSLPLEAKAPGPERFLEPEQKVVADATENSPVINSLQRQLDAVQAAANDSRTPVSKRVEAQMAVDQLQKKLDAVRLSEQAAVAQIHFEDSKVQPVNEPQKRPAQQPPVVLQPGNRMVPTLAKDVAVTPQPRVETQGFFTKPAPLQTAAEKSMRPEPRTGKVYSSASPEKVQETITFNQQQHATNPIPATEGNLPERPGVPQGKDVSTNPKEVRGQEGQQTSGSSSLLSGAKTPEVVKAEAAAIQADPNQIKNYAAKAHLLEGGALPEQRLAAVAQGVAERLNAALRAEGVDPTVKFQEAVKTAEQLPARDLLAHPVNADFKAWVEKLAERHNVTLSRTDSPIIAPDGQLKSGAAWIADRLAKWRGNLATLDTALHEIGHIFFDDLRTSSDPAARALYDEGMRIFGGDEERLMQALGVRAENLVKMNIDGNLRTNFIKYAKEFWHWVKGNFSSEAHITNLLARRMVDGEMVARGERPALAAGDTGVRYQSSPVDEARTKEVGETLRANDFTLPLIRPILEHVRRIPVFGEHLFKSFHEFYNVRDQMLGAYKNQAGQILNRLDPWAWLHGKSPNADMVAERMLREREDPHYTGPEMEPHVDAAYKELRELFDKAAQEATQRGIKVMDGDEFRDIFINHRYMPHVMSGEASYIMAEKAGTPEYKKLKDAFIDWVMKGGLKGPANGVSLKAAQAIWEERVPRRTTNMERSTGGFGPLELAAGMGLPPEMRERKLGSILNRYFDRYADKVAWYETVEKDTPDNNVTRTMLDATDQFGSKEKNATHMKDGQQIEIMNSEPVQQAVKDMLRNYDRGDKIGDSVNRFIKSNMMQTVTGVTDFIGGYAGAAQHLSLADYVALTPRAVATLADGIRAGLRQNVVQQHAARIQAGSMEGGSSAPSGARLDNIVTKLNQLSDGIYKITGRDAFERWGRGLLMNMGMLKTEAVIGKIRAGSHTAADIKWMDTFMDRGKWEGLIKDGADGITTELQERIAAKFVQSVQGTYDARGLPAWALSGQFSPFFGLAKWNLEKANNFTKYVINPARRGDFAPFLKMTGMAVGGGELIHLMRQMITGHKPQDAEWDEIMDAGGRGIDYRLLASMAYSGYSGALADVIKQGYDLAKGNQAQGFRFPVVSAIQGFANRGSQFMQAVEQGENIAELLPRFVTTIAKDNVQMVRALARYASEDESQNVEKGNALRDLRVFRQQQGMPTPATAGQLANPFLNPLKKEYQRSATSQQAAAISPQLVRQAVERSGGDQERLRSLLRNYAAPSADLAPSMTRTPVQFSQYIQWLRNTQGEASANRMVHAYMVKSATDQMKRAMIPSM